MSAPELRICGLAAVRARFERDAKSIQRLYFDYATGRKIGIMTKALAAARKIYRCIEPEELEKVAGTIHHGGIVAVVAAAKLSDVHPDALVRWAKAREPVLVLDRVGNAHNLGALARTAAFFGVPHIVIPGDATTARPNDAAYRVAEGGLEWIEVHSARDLPAFLRALASAGYAVVGTSPHGKGGSAFPTHGPIALVLGNEEHGVGPETTAACTHNVTIHGSGKLESLNVSAAGAVLISRLFAKAK
ncbi:MAG TPA: RNA methyltransferase [Opitutaceae bacterium]|jgi:TrmH RNA methyltransferase